MTISSISTSRTYLTQQLLSLKDELTDRTTQLATGKVGSTYGDIGDRRLLDIQLTQKVDLIASYRETITISNLHLETMTLSLDRLETIRSDGKSALDTNDFVLQSDGQTQTQARAELLLNEALNILNTEVAGFYPFGGTDAVSDPVQTIDAILNGSGTQDGLSTYMDQFSQANLGASNNGRMTVSTPAVTAGPVASAFTVSEDGAHSFGFDISAVTSTLSNVTLTAPTGAEPDNFSFQFTGQPTLGEEISITLTLPPAHTETTTITLTAATGDQAEGTFAIGADLIETAQNLRDAIAAELENEAQTTLKAKSDLWASDEFFGTFSGEVPERVQGPTYTTATALVADSTTTLEWYTGDNTTTTDPRTDKNAVIDTNLTIEYGVRANETPLKELIQALATFTAADFSGGTQTDEEYYNALSTELRSVLQPAGIDQSGIVDISTDIAIAYRTASFTDDRHFQMMNTYEATIGEIEGVDQDLVAAEILQLETNIQVSYQASSIVFNLSLADFLR